MMIRLCSSVLFASLLLSIVNIHDIGVSAFQQCHIFGNRASTIHRAKKHHGRSALLQKAKRSKGVSEPPKNEFSRLVPSDKVLKLHGKHYRNRPGSDAPSRQYSVDIEASPEECEALADRFQISSIENLGAELSMSPEGTSAMDSARGILVQGVAHAKLTQTCVRSNENFQVNLEFPLYSVVRPVEGIGQAVPSLDSDTETTIQLNRDTKSRKRNKNNDYGDDEIDPAEMLKIQSMLEDMEQHKEDYEDVLMEDENIYGSNGILDVGELVAQLFWLQLDPYPKKPGTEFSKFSISG